MNINIKDLSKEQREDLLKQLQDYKEQPSWEELKKRKHEDCFHIIPNGTVHKTLFVDYESSNHYQTREMAELHAKLGEVRKVARAFDGYNEKGKWSFNPKTLNVWECYDFYHLDEIKFNTSDQAHAFMDYFVENCPFEF